MGRRGLRSSSFSTRPTDTCSLVETGDHFLSRIYTRCVVSSTRCCWMRR